MFVTLMSERVSDGHGFQIVSLASSFCPRSLLPLRFELFSHLISDGCQMGVGSASDGCRMAISSVLDGAALMNITPGLLQILQRHHLTQILQRHHLTLTVTLKLTHACFCSDIPFFLSASSLSYNVMISPNYSYGYTYRYGILKER